MPQIIPVLIAVAGAGAAEAAIAALVVTAGQAVYGKNKERRLQKQAKADFNAQLQDRKVTKVAVDAPASYIYGRARVGSSIIAMFTSGDRDQYKHLVCVLADHESDAIEEVWIAGKKLGTIGADGWVTDGPFTKSSTEYGYAGAAASATSVTLDFDPLPDTIRVVAIYRADDNGPTPIPFSRNGRVISWDAQQYPPNGFEVGYHYTKVESRVRVLKHLGVPGEPADATLMATVPDKWDASCRVSGKTYMVVTVDLNEPDFQGGPPTIEALVRGAKLYNFRTGVTAWSQNPAEVIYHYLTSDMCGIPAAHLPMSRFITAANVCDEGFWIGNRYTINGVVTADQPQAQVLEMMAEAMAGTIVATTWDIAAGKYVAPVLSLVEDDVVGSLQVVPGVAEADLCNGIRGQYAGADNEYVAGEFTPYQNAAYVAADGRELWADRTYPFTSSLQRVHNLARIEAEQLRNGYTVKGNFSRKAWKLKVGDRVTLTNAVFGWAGKVFIVLDKRYSPTSAVELTLKEDAPSIWDYADAVTADDTPNSGLPDPFYAPPVGQLTCSSGTDVLQKMGDGTIVSRILVQWPPAAYLASRVELEWQVQGSGVWQSTSANGDTLQAYLSPVEDGKVYVVRARNVSQNIANVQSDWTYAWHIVIGKSEPPADVEWFSIEGDTLSWGAVGDSDLAGYRIRYHYGLNRSWGDAHPLHAGLLTQSPYTPDARPQGQITLMIKAVDTTGNESGNFAAIQTNFGDVLVANVVESLDFKAGGYPGTETGGTITGGVLKADAVSLFFGADGALFFNQYDTAPLYVDNYSSLVYETPIVTPTKAAVGSQMTLNAGLSGDAINIEYRMSGWERFFPDLDSEPFYGASGDPLFEPEPVYQPWPGQVAARNIQYQFRFSAGQSPNQGLLDACEMVIDVPDVSERLNDIVILAAGTRLPIVKKYSTITNVQLTLQGGVSGAVKAEIADKNATLGPLIRCRDASGTLVTGSIDAVVQGY